MHGKRKEIPANLFRPDRETCQSAISAALLKIRADYGISAKELAKICDCGPDAIYSATNEQHLMTLDSVALLCDAFPEETRAIRALFMGGIAPAPTPEERIDRLRRELEALAREVAA